MIVLVAAVLKKTPTYAPSSEAASGGESNGRERRKIVLGPEPAEAEKRTRTGEIFSPPHPGGSGLSDF